MYSAFTKIIISKFIWFLFFFFLMRTFEPTSNLNYTYPEKLRIMFGDQLKTLSTKHNNPKYLRHHNDEVLITQKSFKKIKEKTLNILNSEKTQFHLTSI